MNECKEITKSKIEGDKCHESVLCEHSERGGFLPSEVIREGYVSVKLIIKDKVQFVYKGIK